VFKNSNDGATEFPTLTFAENKPEDILLQNSLYKYDVTGKNTDNLDPLPLTVHL
jgi:hypothetical protein